VYKGTDAAIFGSRASGGALAVYTKRRNPNYKAQMAKQPAALGLAIVKVAPFYQAREFYQPRYNALVVNSLPDPRRTTLYWNPDVRTNASGETKLYRRRGRHLPGLGRRGIGQRPARSGQHHAGCPAQIKADEWLAFHFILSWLC
jgi:hypothetical protein